MTANTALTPGSAESADVAPYDEETDGDKYLKGAFDIAANVVNGYLEEGYDWKQLLICVLACAFARDAMNTHMSGDKRRELEKDIDSRFKELEASAFEYSGAWRADTKYRRNQFVSHGGSMWHAQIDSRGIVPGDGAFWKLAVKRGRDRERF